MTHLRIEQNTTGIEEVSGAVIAKLYDLVHSGTLDNTSNLQGRLHTTATYQDYIDYLEDAFKVGNVKQLIIDTNKRYMSFADPEVASYWANSTYGDGTGIDVTTAASVLSIPNTAFRDNISIQTFDELATCFPNCTTIGESAFQGCSNLTSVNLSNITHVEHAAFKGCSSLGTNQDLDITLDQYRTEAFYGTAYRSVTLHCTQTSSYEWSGNWSAPFAYMPNLLKLDLSDTKMDKFVETTARNLTTLILPTTMTQILWSSFNGSTNTLQYIVILANNIVPLESADYMLHGLYHPNANVYVPDNLVSQYQSTTNWSNISTRIKGISELPSSVTWYTKDHPATT